MFDKAFYCKNSEKSEFEFDFNNLEGKEGFLARKKKPEENTILKNTYEKTNKAKKGRRFKIFREEESE